MPSYSVIVVLKVDFSASEEQVKSMALELKTLSKVDRDSEYLIFGFIRQSEIEFDKIIPPLISWTCLMFYWMNEYFEFIGDTVIASENQLTITSMGDAIDCWQNTSFGKQIIQSTNEGIYKWILSVIGGDAVIGISDSDQIRTDNHFAWDNHTNYYALVSRSGSKVWKKNNDTEVEDYCDRDEGTAEKMIAVILNLKLRQISFEIDGVDKGVAIENIKCTRDY